MIKLPNIKGFASLGKAAVAAHKPEILFGTSLVSTVAAVVAAARGGYKSGQEVMRAEYADLDLVSPEGKSKELDVKEKIQLTWLNYLPAAGLTGAALGSTTGLHLVHIKEKKAIAAAALMAIEEVKEQSKEYVDGLKDAIESNTDEKTQQKIADDFVDPDGDGVIHRHDSDGIVEEMYLVRDGKTGRDIWSNTAKIDEAVNLTNKWLAKHGDCDLNTFYSHAGFGHIPDGDDWGWSGDFVELKWDTIVRDDGRPVKRFAFQSAPKEGVCS